MLDGGDGVFDDDGVFGDDGVFDDDDVGIWNPKQCSVVVQILSVRRIPDQSRCTTPSPSQLNVSVEFHKDLFMGLFCSHSTPHLWLTSSTNTTSFTTSMPTTIDYRTVTFPKTSLLF